MISFGHQVFMNVLESVVDIETLLKYELPSVQSDIRATAKNVIVETKKTGTINDKKLILAKEQMRILKSLKQKDVVYVKADKGNQVVILNKSDYDNRVLQLINECKYKEIKRNPLKKMIREVNSFRQRVRTIFGDRVCRSLIVSNPILPKLYALPKTHKEGKKMRPIVSNVNAPCYRLAKWLVKELKCLPKLETLSVKNSFDFVNKIKHETVNDNEIMISFDVSSLFPSIPVNLAIDEMEKYLNNVVIDNDKKSVYLETARLCMNQSFFEFRGKIYKVEHGTNMGNPLSPIIAEFFMSALEIKLKKEGKLPRVWYRYVDDVFAIVTKDCVNNVLSTLNAQFESIKFTHEMEIDGKLPFLDLEIQRVGTLIEFGVYHKPTTTKRTITNDSNCPIQHKMSAYHSMIHRLCRLPLSILNFKKEYDFIMETARVNGYEFDLIEKMIRKHSNKVRNSSHTTFFTQNLSDNDEFKRVSFNYSPNITYKLHTKFKEHGMKIVYRSEHKLSQLLGSTKDKTPQLKKSGVYVFECSECKIKYYGQTKRDIETRFNDHCQCIRLNFPRKSAIASHVLIDGHAHINKNDVKLLKQVNDARRLDAYESYYIQRDNNVLNLDGGNITSCLLALID